VCSAIFDWADSSPEPPPLMGESVFVSSASLFLVLLGLLSLSSDVSAYKNPVMLGTHDSPDPGVMWDPNSNQYLMVHTAGYNIPILCSPDLLKWTMCASVFTDETVPKWGDRVYWAPEMHYIKAKKLYVLLFSANSTTAHHMRIGIAFAKDPIKGPWKDLGHQLVKMNPLEVENIDATLLQDPKSKKVYLIWKTRTIRSGTRIWGQELSSSLRSFKKGTKAKKLFGNTLPWEGWTVEGPTVLYRSGYYYLFYSGNTCCEGVKSKYQVGVARSKSPLGKYEKHGAPILSANAKFAGPGHCAVLPLHANSKKIMMVYHAYLKGAASKTYPGRYLMVDQVLWKGKGKKSWPYIKGGSPSTK